MAVGHVGTDQRTRYGLEKARLSELLLSVSFRYTLLQVFPDTEAKVDYLMSLEEGGHGLDVRLYPLCCPRG